MMLALAMSSEMLCYYIRLENINNRFIAIHCYILNVEQNIVGCHKKTFHEESFRLHNSKNGKHFQRIFVLPF